MRNHQSRPTGSSPFPEANATSFKGGRGRGRGCGSGRSRRRGRNNIWRRNGHNSISNENDIGRPEKEKNSTYSKKFESKCYRCGMANHWSRTCRTPKHLIELYQASVKKKKEKEVETNFAENDSNNLLMDAHLDVYDLFANVDEEIDIMK